MTEQEQMTECVFTCNKSKEERLNDIKERINELREEKKKLEYELMEEKSVPPVYMVYDSSIFSERYAPRLFKNSIMASEYIERTGNYDLKWKEVGICFELYDEEVK